MWTIINRSPYDVTGREIQVPFEAGMRYFDLWHGAELNPEFDPQTPQLTKLSFDLEAHGFGAVLATHARELPGSLHDVLAGMHSLARRKLADYGDDWAFLPQHMVEIPATEPAVHAPRRE